MKKSINDFEQLHGHKKIDKLKNELQIEKAKVSQLAAQQRKPISIEATHGHAVFGVVSDTHIGSLYANVDGLLAFYQMCASKGITTILHAGDMVEGWRMYKGQEFELEDIGFDAQLQSVITKYPKLENIKTYFITGNHDLSFKKLSGINIGDTITKERPDLIHIGEVNGNMSFDFANGKKYNVRLMHPAGGTPYALSYKLQKTVESFEGGTKPSMLIQGHFHKAEFIPAYRNVSCLQAGTFQWQTPFMAAMPSSAHVGGWIVEVIAGMSWNRVNAEFVAFYR